MLKNVGIIGNKGNIGRRRESLIKENYPTLKVFGYDVDSSWHSNYKDFLDNVELDAVFICVPHALTKEMVLYALDKGLHVFAEKPPGICLDDTIKIAKKINRSNGLKLKFGFNHRYYSHVMDAKKIIDSKQLGELLWIRGVYGKVDFENWRINEMLAGHGILISQGIHLIDLFRYFSDSEFTTVKSIVSRFKGEWYDDNVFAIMESDNKVSAFLHSSCMMGKNTFDIMIGMQNGYLNINGLFTRSKSFGFPETLTVGDASKPGFYGNPKQTVDSYGADPSWLREIDEFFKCIEMDKPVEVGSIRDALNIMAVVNDIYRDGGIL